MRLDRKKQEQVLKRKGNSVRTIIQLVWLGISFVAAYFIMTTLLNDGRYLTYNMLRSRLFIPAGVPNWILLGAMMFVIVIFFQFFLAIGFFLSDPQGRRRLGDPSMHSRNKDPFDKDGRR